MSAQVPRTAVLTVDMGNTEIDLGVFVRGTPLWTGAVPHREVDDPGAAVLAAVPEQEGWAGAVIASVVPDLNDAVAAACQKLTGHAPVWADHRADLGITVAVPHPEEAGADRLVNSAAAYHLYGGPAVVVDVGTAITVSAVSSEGAYLGGAIAPGPFTAMEALAERAARLDTVPLTAPETPIGTTTEAAMRQGTVIGFAGLVDRLVAETVRALGEKEQDIPVCLTGGLSRVLSPHLNTRHRHEEHLTLMGLAMLFARTAGPGRQGAGSDASRKHETPP